ncbi:MAG: DUF2752 domain-containing protein [Niabella sp.]
MEGIRPTKKWLLAVPGILFLLGLYFFVFPRHQAVFPKCPSYTFFHFHCPGCGSQRALSAITHGNLLDALHQNALMVICLPLLIWHYVLVYKGKNTFMNAPWFAITFLVATILFAVLRNINIPPFNFLTPY